MKMYWRVSKDLLEDFSASKVLRNSLLQKMKHRLIIKHKFRNLTFKFIFSTTFGSSWISIAVSWLQNFFQASSSNLSRCSKLFRSLDLVFSISNFKIFCGSSPSRKKSHWLVILWSATRAVPYLWSRSSAWKDISTTLRKSPSTQQDISIESKLGQWDGFKTRARF